MVWRDTKAPAEAAAFAMQLLSAEAQADLLTYRGALALRPAQALRQLAFVAPKAQGPELITSPANDITQEDAWGPRTDGNSAARALARGDLLSALGRLTGNAEYPFDFVRSFNGPTQDLTYLSDVTAPVASGPVPDDPVVRDTLAAAEAAAKAGLPYVPPPTA